MILEVGPLLYLRFHEETRVPPSTDRLRWMILNAHRLIPKDRKKRTALGNRVIEHPGREDAVTRLEAGKRKGISRKLILEKATACDCLIECKNAFIWIEGKFNDCISPGTTWDSSRDQLARNLEAVRLLATQTDKDYCLIICHERELKCHEELLIRGYRNGTWQGGWPHLDEAVRRQMADRIGLVTWHALSTEWKGIGELWELQNLLAYHSPDLG